jgi:hypothetical protein
MGDCLDQTWVTVGGLVNVLIVVRVGVSRLGGGTGLSVARSTLEPLAS